MAPTAAEVETARVLAPIRIPWWQSQVLVGLFISVVLKLVSLLFQWKPPIGDVELQALIRDVALVISFVGDAVVWHGRVSSTLQPITMDVVPRGKG